MTIESAYNPFSRKVDLVGDPDSGINGLKYTPTVIGNVEGDSGDTTKRISLSTYQQTSPSEPYGDLIRLIAEHGFAKGGLKFYARGTAAEVVSSNTEPYAVTTGQTLQLKVNGGPTRTITFQTGTGQTFTSGAATADQISNIITKNVNFTAYPSGQVTENQLIQSKIYITQSGTSVPADTLKVSIASGTYGVNSTIEIVGGTAAAGLGFSVGTTAGVDGPIDGGVDGFLRQLGWIVAHSYPNDVSSNNEHQHMSFEVADSTGSMQTRLSIQFGKDVAQLLISSAMLIADSYPITISNSANSFGDLDFSIDNTGRQIMRRFQIRRDAISSGGNTFFKVFDDAGVGTTIFTFNRLNKFAALSGAIQTKIRTTTNNSASTLALTPQNGNIFVIAGTTTINLMDTTNWQAGSEITLIFQGACPINNGTAASGANKGFKLSGSANFAGTANGATFKFIYDGSSAGYNDKWLEVSRILY